MTSGLRILMVAPQPFFRARGTPLSVVHRIRALARLGHSVDLVTYPFGEDPGVERLTIHRAARPPFVRDVAIGPSPAKVALDVTLLALAMRLADSGRYDLLHTHEEAGLAGHRIARRRGMPHLYDMHSSLPQQFSNFGRYQWRPVIWAFERLERAAVFNADGLIVVYPGLERHVRGMGYTGPVAVIENTLDFDRGPSAPGEAEDLRRHLGLGPGPVVLYAGTLEAYQGMDLLVKAVALLARRESAIPAATRFVSVGGTPDQARSLEELAAREGVSDRMVVVPMVPPQDVFKYYDLADVLVTCRTRGTNTPLKIYQYLRAGKPIVATAIESHTQVLDEEVAELVPPTSDGIAAGIERVLAEPARASSLARAAAARAAERYGPERYVQSLEGLVDRVMHCSRTHSGAA